MDIAPLPATPTPVSAILMWQAVELQAPESWVAWSFIVFTAFCCLVASAFVSGSEMAYFGLEPHELDELEDSGDPRRQAAFRLVSHNERLLATILITNNLVNITMVVLLSFAIGQTMIFHSAALNVAFQTVFLTFLLLLFGEILPKLVARGRALQWVVTTVPVMAGLYRLLSPAARFMVRTTHIVNRVVTKKQESISTDQLEKALEISDIDDAREKEMLEGILSFGEKEVSDIMVPRIDVTAIDFQDTWSRAMEIILESGYSRIPVYDVDRDTVRGILYSKDLLPYIGKRNDSFRWQTLMREPYYVPESRMIDDLLEDFRKKKMHMAVVVDEYGSTRGIVTLEDIIEEIVGEIDDEYDDRSSDMWRKVGPRTYIFDAKIPLYDFYDAVGLDADEVEDRAGDAETLAGLLLEVKGDFPTPKETLMWEGLRFHVLKMERHRIVKVKVELPEPNTSAT